VPNPSQLPSGCALLPDISGWIAADLDTDGDVDHDDHGHFQRCYSGANRAPPAGCGP
jgi:hypothetical protein